MLATVEKKNPLLTVPIKYAVVGGVLSIILFFVMLFFDKNPLISNKYFDFFLLPIFIFICIHEFKKFHNQDILHFWEGMTAGFFTYLYIGLIMGLFIWGYVSLVSPELLQDFISTQTTVITDNQAEFTEQFGEATYQQMLVDMQLVTATDLALDDFIRKLMIGFFVSTVVSVILRRLPAAERELIR